MVPILKMSYITGYLVSICCIVVTAYAILSGQHSQGMAFLIAFFLGFALYVMIHKLIILVAGRYYPYIFVTFIMAAAIISVYWWNHQLPVMTLELPLMRDKEFILAYQGDLKLTVLLGFFLSFSMHSEKIMGL